MLQGGGGNYNQDNMKKEMTLYDAVDIATRVNFLTERWEVKMYAIALREAFLWGKYVK